MIKKIHVDWRGPFELDDIKKSNQAKNYGIYQYYGTHPVYGTNTLLYLGKASDNIIQSRIKSHAHNTWSSTPIEIYLGNIIAHEKLSDKIWSQHINLAEKLLIYTHSPAWNSQNIKSIVYSDFNNVHIFNWGNRAMLLPEVSYERWCEWGNHKPDDLIYQDDI